MVRKRWHGGRCAFGLPKMFAVTGSEVCLHVTRLVDRDLSGTCFGIFFDVFRDKKVSETLIDGALDASDLMVYSFDFLGFNLARYGVCITWLSWCQQVCDA